jgi:hypothetical protein
MRIYCLRTVYEMTNLGFANEGVIRRGATGAHLVRQCKLPEATHKITGIKPDGKKQVVVTTVDRTFHGHPLLLEIVATNQTSENVTPADIRPELEARTAELAALLTWSLPGTVGVRLADALFWRAPGDPPNEWTWDDVKSITVEGFFPSIDALTFRYAASEPLINSQSPAPRDVVMSAMRWWRHGLHAEAPVDSFIAYWVVLETASSEISNGDSIRVRVEDALAAVFPALAQIDTGRRTKQMRDVLYDARCKAVHAGRRDLSNIQTLVEIARTTALACIEFLIDGSASNPPDEHLLITLGI